MLHSTAETMSWNDAVFELHRIKDRYFTEFKKTGSPDAYKAYRLFRQHIQRVLEHGDAGKTGSDAPGKRVSDDSTAGR